MLTRALSCRTNIKMSKLLPIVLAITLAFVAADFDLYQGCDEKKHCIGFDATGKFSKERNTYDVHNCFGFFDLLPP